MLRSQACLNEIHAKMLRKHLERLQRPLGSDDNLERDQSLTPKHEDTDHDENGNIYIYNVCIFLSGFFLWDFITPSLSHFT